MEKFVSPKFRAGDRVFFDDSEGIVEGKPMRFDLEYTAEPTFAYVLRLSEIRLCVEEKDLEI